jgi:hypothetical protein
MCSTFILRNSISGLPALLNLHPFEAYHSIAPLIFVLRKRRKKTIVTSATMSWDIFVEVKSSVAVVTACSNESRSVIERWISYEY